MKNKAIVSNIGHFDNEIDMAGLAKVTGITKTEIKPQVHEWTFANGKLDHRPVRGSPDEPRQRDGSPELRHVQLVQQPDDRPDRAVHEERRLRQGPDVTSLPKHLDEKVARLHLAALGVELTELTKEQAEYIGVDVAGPYKPEHYRY